MPQAHLRPAAELPKQLPPECRTTLLKWVLNHDFITTAISDFSTVEHLERDFSVAKSLTSNELENKLLADKTFAAEARVLPALRPLPRRLPEARRCSLADAIAYVRRLRYRRVSMVRHLLAK